MLQVASETLLPLSPSSSGEETHGCKCRYQHLAENIQTAVVETRDGKIAYANPPAARLFLFSTPQEMVGLPAGKLLDETVHPAASRWVTRLEQGERIDLEQARMTLKDGTSVKVNVKGCPLACGEKTGAQVLLVAEGGKGQPEADELNALAHLSDTLRSAQSRAEVYPALLEHTMGLLGAQGVAIAVQDPTSRRVIFKAAAGKWASWVGNSMELTQGITGSVIASQEVYASRDVTCDPLCDQPDLFNGLNCVVGVPLVSMQQVLGAMWVGYPEPPADEGWVPVEILRFLNAVSGMAASAVYQSILKEQTELRLQRLAALHEIDMAITSSKDIRFTMELFLAQVTTQLNVDAADVFLLDSAGELQYVAGRGFRFPAVQKTILRPGRGLSERVVHERRLVHIRDLKHLDDPFDGPIMDTEPDFVTYYGVPLISGEQVRGVVELFHRSPLEPDAEWINFLEALATQAVIAVNNADLIECLKCSNQDLVNAYDSTIEGWARALELRDRQTGGHTQRVTRLTMDLAKRMQIPEADLEHLRRGVLLHDIGKMAIPDEILLKPGPLSDEEWKVMRRHPIFAYELLSTIPFLARAIDIPYCHHERWNGSGYPRGLKGEEIPLAARIFAVVDVWDALSSDRPYRSAWSILDVEGYIRDQASVQFDPQVVDAFLRMMGDIGETANREPTSESRE